MTFAPLTSTAKPATGAGLRPLLLAIALCLPLLASAAEALALVSFLDGNATLVRGTGRFALAEGFKLESGDIVESGSKTGLTRLEWQDGSLMDLGPSTRLLMRPLVSGETAEKSDKTDEKAPAAKRLFILSGWVKLTVPAGKPAQKASAGYFTQKFETSGMAGVSVAYSGDGEALLYVESGETTLTERQAGKPRVGQLLKPGQAYAQSQSNRSAVLPKLPPSALAQMPVSFRDSLPARAGKFQGKEAVALRPLPTPLYADLAPWLTAMPSLRREFVKRFKPLAKDADFRAAVIANMAAHPEWEAILSGDKAAQK